MTIEQTLTGQERLADLDLDQLASSSGSSSTTPTGDPFPVTGWDAVVWVGRQRHPGRAATTRPSFGMELVAYSGPETGNRDHHAYVLRSGAVRFVLKGGVDPASPLLDHHRRHGDGIVDIALEVPDVDRCIAHARAQGATVLDEPHDVTDEHGTVRIAAIATYGDTRHTPRRPLPLHRPVPARLRRPHVAATPSRRARRSGCSRRSTTSSATSSSARWTSGSTSTTGSWASPTWPSSSATTSPPSTRR